MKVKEERGRKFCSCTATTRLRNTFPKIKLHGYVHEYLISETSRADSVSKFVGLHLQCKIELLASGEGR